MMNNIKTEVQQSLDGAKLIPMEYGGTLKIPTEKASITSIMDLGRMLLEAAKDGNTKRVYELITKGAPFTTDWLGTTPLHFAAKNNHLETCRILLRGGLCKDARTKVDRTPLHLAVFEEHADIVELLLKNNCDPNVRDMLKMTPLHWAVEKENIKIAEVLIRYGADVNVESKFGKTPITMAVQKGNSEMINKLLDPTICLTGIGQTEAATKSLEGEMTQMDMNKQTKMETNENVESSPLNDSSLATEDDFIEEDDGISVSDTMNQLNDEDISVESIGFKVLKEHGIQMLPMDSSNTMIQNALESGCKLVLSEAGKFVLKNSTTFQNFPSTSLDSRKRSNLFSISSQKPKIVKILSNNTRQLQGYTSTSPTDKFVNLSKNSYMNKLSQVFSKLDKLPQDTTVTITKDDAETRQERIANVQELEVSDNLDTSEVSQHQSSDRIEQLEMQLQTLRKETEVLRKQLEHSQKQNENYRSRLNKLETAVFGNRTKNKGVTQYGQLS